MCEELAKICIYMVLQEHPWQFVLGSQETFPFSKKEHNCIDGWIKDK